VPSFEPNYPFTAFNFSVEITVPGIRNGVLCDAAFSECDGLEMTMDTKTIREGGNNTAQIRLLGPVNYGQLTLKRGLTSNFDLWSWFEAQQFGTAQQLRNSFRGQVTVVLLSAQGKTKIARWVLRNCLLTRLKAPPLNAKDGGVAIEELQISYESMTLGDQPS